MKRILVTAALVPLLLSSAAPMSAAGSDPAPSAGIKHVVVISFDNTHLSDILHMPALSAELHQGTLFVNDHTGLIAHTHPDFVTEASGLYPSHTGVLNQYQFDGGQGVGFGYWLDKLPNGLATHLSPAPWLYWNRLGMNVAAIGWADMELENSTEVGAYGVKVAPGHTAGDYLGVALHQANGQTVFGSPNLPALYQAPLLLDPGQTFGNFPGWGNLGPDRALSATAAAVTHGAQVVYTYIRSVHNVPGGTLIPGTAAYQQNLARYNAAFAAFFQNLRAHGIHRSNTLFLFTTDEGDHFAPGGEMQTSLPAWMGQIGVSSANVQIDGDQAAMLYAPPGQSLSVSRFVYMPGWRYLATDPALRAIHLDTALPAYNPSLVVFGEPSWWYEGSGTSTAVAPSPRYVWDHGSVSSDINSIWAGFVGPGVTRQQVSHNWVDSTDLLPTLQKLVTGHVQQGLDGTVMVPALQSAAAFGTNNPQTIQTLSLLEKRINAPVGTFGIAALRISTQAIISPHSGMDQELAQLVAERDRLNITLHRWIRSVDNGHSLPQGVVRQMSAQADHLLAAIGHLEQNALLR